MAAVTGGVPKELLRLGSRTVLGRVIEEALSAGVDQVLVVNSKEKPEIDAFVANLADARVAVRYQQKALGLADSIASAEVQDDAIVLLGDTVYVGGSPCSTIADLLRQGFSAAVAASVVPDDQVHLYGILGGGEWPEFRQVMEKPSPVETSSRWAIAARYGFSARVMKVIAEQAQAFRRGDLIPGAKELALTEAFNYTGSRTDWPPMIGVPLTEGQRRVDCGSPEEYVLAKELTWD